MNSAVPEIAFALIFVVAFGLGTLPGVLALALHGTGALATLYSEVVESIDAKLRLAVIGPMSIPLQGARFAHPESADAGRRCRRVRH